MFSSVLRSTRAVQVNIEIMRTFVRLRQIRWNHKDLAHKLDTLEKRYDAQFKIVFDAIRQLMTPAEPKKRRIGFIEGTSRSISAAKESSEQIVAIIRNVDFEVSRVLETWKFRQERQHVSHP